jgi:hypothetical protein
MLLFFCTLFVVFSIAAIYYSQGYRVDFSTLSLKKIGALYIETQQSPVQIYLNQHLFKDKSGIFTKGTFISSILPKRYRLVIRKEGFRDYEKNIAVEPAQVVRLFNVDLVPVSLSYAMEFPAASTRLVAVRSGKKLLAYDEASSTYLLIDFGSQEKALSPADLGAQFSAIAKQKPVSLSFNPRRSGSFIARTAQGIFSFDLDGRLAELYGKPAGDMRITSDAVAILAAPTSTKAVASSRKAVPAASTSTLSLLQPDSGALIRTLELPMPLAAVRDIRTSKDYTAALSSSGSLVLYSASDKAWKEVAHSARFMSFSDDGQKLLYQDKDGKVFILMLERDLETLGANKGDIIRLSLADAEQIQDILWYDDSYHLILKYPNAVRFAEVTAQEPNNQYALYEGRYDEAVYEPADNLLVIRHGGTASVLDMNFK